MTFHMSFRTGFVWLLAVFTSVDPATAAEPSSELGKLAASMQTGSWAKLETQGYDRELLRVQSHFIYEYTHDGQWDPVTAQMLFVGQGHYSALKFISYSAKTNSWTLRPTPSWWKGDPETGKGPIGHAYDNNALDPQGRILYHHQYNSPFIHRWHIDDEKWIDSLELDRNKYGPGGHSSGLVWFPEMGGLVRGRVNGTIDFHDPKKAEWRIVDAEKRPTGNLHNFIEYSPGAKRVIFGGGNGSNDVYSLDPSGQVETLAKPPLDDLNSTHRFVITVDPVSGEFLVIKWGNREANGPLYGFDSLKNEWRQISATVTPQGFMIGTPVANHGVVMICTYRPEEVWLYKHAPRK
ncbi:MAG: hypothetical protein WD066_04515 [Planctomycetaceae bacterium]